MKLNFKYASKLNFSKMRNCIFFLFIALILSVQNLYSQYATEISAGAAPWLPKSNSGDVFRSVLTNPHSVGFSYYYTSPSGSQLFKYKVGYPGTTTLVGSVQPYFLGSGDFANPTGVWKFYVINQNSPYTIYEVDTATGVLTSVGVPGPLKSGHIPTDFEWDHVTNSFYIISLGPSLDETQLYRMNWPTKQLSWIGSSVTRPGAIIAGGFNANGTYFGIDMMSDSLWKVNKSTGIWTRVGYLGYPVNYAQDAGFDRTDFSRMLWCACGNTVGLYEVDTSNAHINYIGSFPSYTQVIATGFIAGAGGPQITVTKLNNTENLAGPYAVNAVITPGGSGIAAAKLFWSRNNTTITDSINMTNTGGTNWTVSIPGNGLPATYRYYGYTKDSLGRFAVSPLGAPSNLNSFLAMSADTVKPVITHTPLNNITKASWPLYISAEATDNLGIDSVWVRWRVNSNSVRHLKLPKFSGDVYSTFFNSTANDVFAYDTVFYRIFAQDNSSNHNKDSTILYSIVILPSEYTCIGNGTAIIQTLPFNTINYGNRTQLLYKVSEIQNAGGGAGLITKIGFDIFRADTLPMQNFSIKMQNYYDTIVTSFVENGWTTVFSGTYTVPATGWQYITFQNAFEWDGLNNALVQICFENNTKSFYSQVRATNLNSRTVAYQAQDLNSACSAFNNPSIWTYRPNTCFKFEIPSGFNNTGVIPEKFSLSQNYPNPFNPVTRINYEIPKQGFVSLKIYDILGREVKVLVSEMKTKGKYSVDFDAAGIPSGIYLYRMESGGFTDSKRMILLK